MPAITEDPLSSTWMEVQIDDYIPPRISSTNPPTVSTDWIETRIEEYTTMLTSFTLTPRLRERIHHTRAVFRIAHLDQSNVPSSELLSLHQKIHNHWTYDFGTPDLSELTVERIQRLREFLINLFLEEYVAYLPSPIPAGTRWGRGNPSSVTKLAKFEQWGEWVGLGRRIKANKMLPDFNRSISELFLDVQQTRKEVELYANRLGKPYSHVEKLIAECDWKELALKLPRDKDIMEKLGAFLAKGKDEHRALLDMAEAARLKVERSFFLEAGGLTAKAETFEQKKAQRKWRGWDWETENEEEMKRQRHEAQKSRKGFVGFRRLGF